MRVIPVFLLVPIACCVNVTRGVPRLDTLLVGTWDVFCGAGTDATLVQHKLELNVTDGDGLVGTASVVSDATFYPVAYWQVILDEGGGGSSGSIVGSSKAGDEPHDFICRIDLHEIAPGVVGSVAIGGGERCAVTLRAENGTQAHLTLEVSDCLLSDAPSLIALLLFSPCRRSTVRAVRRATLWPARGAARWPRRRSGRGTATTSSWAPLFLDRSPSESTHRGTRI